MFDVGPESAFELNVFCPILHAVLDRQGLAQNLFHLTLAGSLRKDRTIPVLPRSKQTEGNRKVTSGRSLHLYVGPTDMSLMATPWRWVPDLIKPSLPLSFQTQGEDP